jgi:hypothetical protein
MLHALPAGFAEGLEGLLEAGGRGDLRRRSRSSAPCRREIQRRDDFAAELRVLFQHRLDGVGRGVLAAGQRVDLVQLASSFITNSMSFRGAWYGTLVSSILNVARPVKHIGWDSEAYPTMQAPDGGIRFAIPPYGT